jgi:hypothetical protein
MSVSCLSVKRLGACKTAGSKARFFGVLRGPDPEAYLREALTHIADHLVDRINDLLPWHINSPPREVSS